MVAAIDIHDRADAVIAQAVPWARRFHGKLDLIFASEWSTEGLPTPPYRTNELDALWADWKRRADEERVALVDLVRGLPEDVRGTERFVTGRALEALPDALSSYDLAVLASHSRHGLERVLLGSVTTRLLRTVRIPMLIVGIGDPAHDPSGRLLVVAPIDEGEVGALPWIRDHLGGEHLEVVHVLPPDRWNPAALLAGPGPYDPEARVRTLEASFKERASAHGFAAPRVHLPHRDTANPGDAIARLAHTLEADVVVMPTQGLKGLERWFLGSVAERVVERAPCPVIVVPTSRTA